MSAVSTSTSNPASLDDDQLRLSGLRDLASRDPAAAVRDAWAWLADLDARRDGARLNRIWGLCGAPAQSPNGHLLGVVLGLTGPAFLRFVDRLERIGQALGGIGWTGKSFDAASGTGYNRLSSLSLLPMKTAMPRYRFRRKNGQLAAFDFSHGPDISPYDGQAVWSLRYDDPAHQNPMVLPRTRDELVLVVPGLYLGRALLTDHERASWECVAWFLLRDPEGKR